MLILRKRWAIKVNSVEPYVHAKTTFLPSCWNPRERNLLELCPEIFLEDKPTHVVRELNYLIVFFTPQDRIVRFVPIRGTLACEIEQDDRRLC